MMTVSGQVRNCWRSAGESPAPCFSGIRSTPGDQIDLNELEALQGAADAGSTVVPSTATTCYECRDAV